MRTPAVGIDAQLVGDLEQHVDLAQLLEHDEHLVAELLAHEGEAHELLVLVAVADDEVVGALGEAEDGLELRLAAALEADAVRLAELDDLLDHVALLVHLDRIHGRVAARVAELLDRAASKLLDASDSMRERRMSEKRSSSGQPHALRFEIHRQLVEVEPALRDCRRDGR